jgi:hypothetical protein
MKRTPAQRTGQFTFFEGALDRRLFRCVECPIAVRVIERELSIHFANMSEHRLGDPPSSIRRQFGRELQPAISQCPGDGFLFRRIKLAVLVCVERRKIVERFGEMFHGGGDVRELTVSAVKPSAAVVAVGECKSADAGDKHASYCEFFDVFHTFLFVVFGSLPWQLHVARSG